MEEADDYESSRLKVRTVYAAVLVVAAVVAVVIVAAVVTAVA